MDNEFLKWKLENADKFELTNLDLSAVALSFSHNPNLTRKYDLRFLANIDSFKIQSNSEFLKNLKIFSNILGDPIYNSIQPKYLNMYIQTHESLLKICKKGGIFCKPFEILKRKDLENSLFIIVDFYGHITEAYLNKLLLTTSLFKQFYKFNKKTIESYY